jgi:hypothetical protein
MEGPDNATVSLHYVDYALTPRELNWGGGGEVQAVTVKNAVN